MELDPRFSEQLSHKGHDKACRSASSEHEQLGDLLLGQPFKGSSHALRLPHTLTLLNLCGSSGQSPCRGYSRAAGLQETHIPAVLRWEQTKSVLGQCLPTPHPLDPHPAWALPKPPYAMSCPDRELSDASNTICGSHCGLRFFGSNILLLHLDPHRPKAAPSPGPSGWAGRALSVQRPQTKQNTNSMETSLHSCPQSVPQLMSKAPLVSHLALSLQVFCLYIT